MFLRIFPILLRHQNHNNSKSFTWTQISLDHKFRNVKNRLCFRNELQKTKNKIPSDFVSVNRAREMQQEGKIVNKQKGEEVKDNVA